MTEQDKSPAADAPAQEAGRQDAPGPSAQEQALSADLAPLRTQIDTVDRELLALLNRRAQLALVDLHPVRLGPLRVLLQQRVQLLELLAVRDLRQRA